MNDSPVETVKLLRERVKQEAEKLGLDVHSFALIPGDDHSPDLAQVVFKIGLEAIESDDETEMRQTDAAFEALVGAEFTGESTTEEQAEADKRLDEQVDAATREALDGLFDD